MKCKEHSVQTGRTYRTNGKIILYKSEHMGEPIYASLCMNLRTRYCVKFQYYFQLFFIFRLLLFFLPLFHPKEGFMRFVVPKSILCCGNHCVFPQLFIALRANPKEDLCSSFPDVFMPHHKTFLPFSIGCTSNPRVCVARLQRPSS